MALTRVATLFILTTLAYPGFLIAQVAGLRPEPVPVGVTSGSLSNETGQTQTIFKHVVAIDGVSSMQVRFGRTKLPTGCVLRMTSLEDGSVQHHRAETLRQWRGASAWFNGPAVLVELVADPGSGSTHVTIDEALILRELAGGERTICGPTDDRVLSDDPRCGRVFPVGCTGWIIDDANHTFLSAGHCADDDGDAETMQFNVPLSDQYGEWQHPGPEDQYAVDPESLQAEQTVLGNDWAYFGCFPNTETGLTPYQAQGAYYELADFAPTPDGQSITITGYGSVSSPVDPTWNLVQKTHTGPYASLDGTIVGYTTDTSGGNSGSAVLDESTGLAIGIHTNGGCGGSGGANYGCAIQNSGLQYALANPKGVCIPNIILFDFPDGRPEAVLPGSPTEMVFTVTAGEEVPVDGTIQVILGIDGSDQELDAVSLGDDYYSVEIPALACDQDVAFYLQAEGDGGTLVTDPYDAPDDRYGIAVGTITEDVVLDVSFEKGLPSDWTATGLWHAAGTDCAPGPSCDGYGVAYFGQDSTCDFQTGNAVSGYLNSPAIPVIVEGGELVLTYCSTLATENLDPYDAATVLINGQIVDEPGDSSSWEERTVVVDSIPGDTITISFQFDSVDSLYNNFTGWHIDKVRLVAPDVECDPDTPCTGDADGNGAVEADDILLIIANWGQPGGPGDVNNDGIIDATDILVVLGSWGPC